MYLIPAFDDGSHQDDDALPSLSINTTTATTIAGTAEDPTTSVIVVNEDVPPLVSCSLIVKYN